jgi:DNA-binding CsgD family transcriptional regulator
MEGARTRRLVDFAYQVGRADGLEEFRQAVTTGVRAVVAGDLASYTEVRLDTGSVLAPLDPEIECHTATQALGRHASEHPLITRAAGHAQTISDYMTARRFHQLELYQDVFRQIGAEDQIAISLPSPAPLRIGVALNRSRRGFDDHDRATLDLLRPLLIKSYTRAVAIERGRRLAASLEGTTAGVLSLGIENAIEFANPVAGRLLRAYFPRSRNTLPDVLSDWIHAHRNQIGARLVVTRGRRRLQIMVVSAGKGDPLTLELSELDHHADCLTARERQIVLHAANGSANEQIADALMISRRTVENHLHAAYRKLGVTNRTAAAAALRQAIDAAAR